MKKMFILILAALPLLSGAQTKTPKTLLYPLVISFSEKSTYKKFTVPPSTAVKIKRIYSTADITKLKLSVEDRIDAYQSSFTQSLIFLRQDLNNFANAGEMVLPERSVIEYDGTPVIIFCDLIDVERDNFNSVR